MQDKPTSQDFLLSILSLDVYNRGLPGDQQGVGLFLDQQDTFIGGAKFERVSNVVLADSADSGFGASEYMLDGNTVISFRGTDFDFTTLDSTIGFIQDVVAGWLPGFRPALS